MELPTPDVRVRVCSPVTGVSGTILYEALDAHGQAIPGPRVAVIARMHGNEPVGDAVLERLSVEVADQLRAGAILTIRANEAATADNQRHTPQGSDLNRLWDADSLARLRSQPPEALSYEEARAVELAPVLLSCDAVLDLHSTSRPAASFLVFRDDQRHAALARRLGVERLVTGLHENGILSGGVGSNVGLRPGEQGPRLGFTFEAGQHTDPGNAERAWQVTSRFLSELGLWRTPLEGAARSRSEVFEVVDRFRQAPGSTPQYRFVGYEGGEPGGGRRGAPRKLHSFEEVEVDEIVLRRGRSEVVRADTPFTMLMPAPHTDPGTDLYYVTQQRHGGLSEGEPRTDPEARGEARAIERMLDLLADDEFERGSTWVSFDDRRLFDLCASIVGRSLRLEEGHPHRRIVVMGRGDHGGSETERRTGQRYRQAMRAAIARGLPVERIQVLRGTPLSWIDAVTGPGMLKLLQERRDRFGPDHPNPRMRVSLRQPHTTSLLVAGDLEHALRTGDTRHVRVAVLVEAATVEPDGPTARVRVVRSGLVSSRSEVIRAADSLLGSLRSEHRYQMRHGALRGEAAVHELVVDGAIETRPDPEALAGLRSSLIRAQLRLWCDLLLHEVTEPVRLATPDELGHWLAQTMTSTGILDASALRSMAIRRDGGGFTADPETIARLYERVHTPSGAGAELPIPGVLGLDPAGEGAPLLIVGASGGASLPQPLLARDVTADTLERWVGWKRFVRGVETIPDTRGKDMDLAFSPRVIRPTLIRWFEAAQRLAAEHPGDVMVVIAGDGLNPTRDRLSDAFALLAAHRRCVIDPNVRYLRIQHAQGTHLSWMKDFLIALDHRPMEGPSVQMQFEVEHGATVNVVMVLQRDLEATEPPREWSLDGWALLSCGVILSDLESRHTKDYQVGMFTDRLPQSHGPSPGGANQELLHFGRAHCDGLLLQARARTEQRVTSTEQFERSLVDQIARWIERVRVWRHSSQSAPRDVEARGRWVARRLGLADARLARALAREMERDTPAAVAAAHLWDSVPPWPGPTAQPLGSS